MKKLTLILLAFVIVFSSCKKEDVSPSDSSNNSNTDNNDNSTTTYLWDYQFSDFDYNISKDIALDNNDNIYGIGKFDNENYVYSINKDGNLNWKVTLSEASYNKHDLITITDNELIIGYNWDKLAALNLSDGSLLWENTLTTGFVDMAYNNGILYLAQCNTFDHLSILSSISPSTGTTNWQINLDHHADPRISVYQDKICLATRNELSTYNLGISIYKDNGSDASLLWRKSTDIDYQSKPTTRAIFDGQGNVYYEEAAHDTSYIHSYKLSDGSENWVKKLCNYSLPDPVILYSNGKIIASYKDDDSWGIVTSIAIIDASSGNIDAQKEGVILADEQVLLQSNNSFLVFNRLKDSKPTIQVLDQTGGLVSSRNTEAFGSLISFDDCRINSSGNLVILDGEHLVCTKANYTSPTIGTWSCRQGTNKNTKSLN